MKSSVLISCVTFAGVCLSAAASEAAGANPMVIPGIGPETAATQHMAQPRHSRRVAMTAAPARPQTHFGPGAHAQAGSYGGGFIELLMTGSSQQHAPRGVMYNRPPEAAPAPVYRAPVAHAAPSVQMHAPRQGAMHGAVYAALPPAEPVARRSIDPQFMRQDVAYGGRHAPGTIVVDTPNRHLYLVTAPGRAVRYGIGVGRPGFEWAGVKSVTRKAEWPDWRPPAEMLKRRPDLPTFMPGGPDNPLGARALYLGSSLYRIHGTNEPHTIGQNVSSGCIRMMNDDVVDLYNRVRVGAKVVVM